MDDLGKWKDSIEGANVTLDIQPLKNNPHLKEMVITSRKKAY